MFASLYEESIGGNFFTIVLISSTIQTVNNGFQHEVAFDLGIRLLKKTVYPLAELAGGNSAKNLSKPW